MPTYKDGQNTVYDLTEKEALKKWALALEAYDKANSGIDTELAKLYAKMPTFTPDELASGGMFTWSVSNKKRLPLTQAEILKIYTEESIKAGNQILLASSLAISNTFYREQYLQLFFSQEELSDVILNPDIINASVNGTTELWQKIQKEVIYGNPKNYFPPEGTLSDLLKGYRDAELEKIQKAVTAGLIQGKSVKDLARDIERIIGTEEIIDGKVKYTGARANAARIARTEVNRNLNAGVYAQMKQAEAQGLEQTKMWNSTLDIRTRGTHATADNQRRKIDENFNVGGAVGLMPHQLDQAGENINCRCRLSPIVDGIEPTIRRGRNPVTGKNEVFTYRGMPDWMDQVGVKIDKNGVIIPVDSSMKINSKGVFVTK